MVVPDFELICEIMLVAEGFQEARVLARKFITLYTLCKELLSKQDHYDWGLRAIKSVLVVAGSLKRGDPGRPEEEVLMRALRDFNIPKIVTDDMPVFMGLYNIVVDEYTRYRITDRWCACCVQLHLNETPWIFPSSFYNRFNFRFIPCTGCATQARPRI